MPSNTESWQEPLSASILKKLELFRMRARRSYLGTRQGGHLSLKRGHGLEFSDYRKYEIGDNPRYIDWGVYARSERLYIKKFQEEQDISLAIILDCSSSMLAPESGEKWFVARKLSLALAYVALMQQDNVRVYRLGGPASPEYYGGRAFHALSAELSVPSAPLDFDDLSSATASVAASLKHPGIAIIFSDFLQPPEQIRGALNVLRAKNLDLTLIQILGAGDLNPLEDYPEARAIDSEDGSEVELSMGGDAQARYEILLEQHNQEISGYCSSAAIRYIQVTTEDDLEAVLIHKLAGAGLLQ